MYYVSGKVSCTSSSLFLFCNVSWMWKYWRRMKGGTPSCVSVIIPPGSPPSSFDVRGERWHQNSSTTCTKTESKTTPVRTYSPPSYVLARENLWQTLLTVVLTDSYTGRVAVPLFTSFLQSRFVFKSITLRIFERAHKVKVQPIAYAQAWIHE